MNIIVSNISNVSLNPVPESHKQDGRDDWDEYDSLFESPCVRNRFGKKVKSPDHHNDLINVVNYVSADLSHHSIIVGLKLIRYYCGPKGFCMDPFAIDSNGDRMYLNASPVFLMKLCECERLCTQVEQLVTSTSEQNTEYLRQPILNALTSILNLADDICLEIMIDDLAL
jgi:hypothetical protein